jgi:hypothetical protein
MTTLYGRVLGIEVTRAEIKLLFGGRTVHQGRGEETVIVSDRIILNPFTAKRLHVLLGKIMARHQRQVVMDGDGLRAFMETSN